MWRYKNHGKHEARQSVEREGSIRDDRERNEMDTFPTAATASSEMKIVSNANYSTTKVNTTNLAYASVSNSKNVNVQPNPAYGPMPSREENLKMEDNPSYSTAPAMQANPAYGKSSTTSSATAYATTTH